MHAIALVILANVMINPLPASSLNEYHAKFAKQFEQPVKVVEYKFNP